MRARIALMMAFAVAATAVANDVANAAARPAFPGAQGPGAASLGGRGGRVIAVTTLNRDGAGSLRAALAASGPRIIVFRVAGIIDLGAGGRIDIDNPHVTIAGQTAPGGGITLQNAGLNIRTHDVVVRYLRIRPGRVAEPTQGVFIREGAQNIIIDHCSFSWATDENITIYASDQPIRAVTVQWSITAEGLTGDGADDHGAGAIVGSVARADRVGDVAFHHNLFAHNQFRNPYIKIASAAVVNNIIYDWQWWAMMIRGGISVDIIGNSFTPGPNFEADSWTTRRGIRYTYAGDNGNYGARGDPSIHIRGNRDILQTDPDADNWPMIEATSRDFAGRGRLDRRFERARPQPGAFPISVQPVALLDDTLLPTVGASLRIDAGGAWRPARDRVDARIVAQFRRRSGILPASVAAVGGYPAIAAGAAYPDTDGDGMADAWERRFGLDPRRAGDGAQDRNRDGYSNFEAFLGGIAP
jgi:pectate lyase